VAVTNATLTTDSTNGTTGFNTDGITNNPGITAPANAETGAIVQYRVQKGAGTFSDWSTNYTAPPSDGSADGSYTVQVRQIDKAGNTSTAQSLSFTLDSSKPAAPNAVLTTDTATTGNNADGITRLGDVTAPTNTETGAKLEWRTQKDSGSFSSWSSTYSAPATDGSADGVYKVQLRQTDKAGNVSDTQEVNFTLDTKALNTLSFDNLTATVNTNQLVSGKGAETGAKVILLDGATTVLAETTAGSDGSFNFTLPYKAQASTASLGLKYTDLAGNSSSLQAATSVTWSSTVSAPAPSMLRSFALAGASDSGVSNSDAITNLSGVTLRGTGAENAATIEVTATVSGTATVLPTVTAGADGTWSVTLSGGNLLSADTVFTVRQQVGSVWSPVSAQYKVFFDSTAASAAPTLLLDAASDTLAQDGITASQNLKFTGIAEAKAFVEIWDNGLKLATAQADALGAWETTLSSVSEGAHTYTARQYDAAGNFSIFSASKAVTVDIRASNLSVPVLDSASDSGTLGDLITTAVRTKLTGAGAEAGATVSVYDSGTLLGTATAKGDGTWSFTPSSDLSVGLHALTVSQTDVAGNTSPLKSPALNLCITAPSSVATSLAPVLATTTDSGVSSTDNITNASTLTFTGTGALVGGKVELWVGASKLTELATTTAGSWSINVTNMVEGAGQSVKARIVDASGNTVKPGDSQLLVIDTNNGGTTQLNLGVSTNGKSKKRCKRF
jgi:hypothetical protein